MNNLEFLQQVLGDEGYYCIVGLHKDTEIKPVQKFFQKLEDAVKVAENLKDEGYEAYYALATFEDGKSRKNEHIMYMESQESILREATDAGFIMKSKIDLKQCAYDYQYLYVLRKPE